MRSCRLGSVALLALITCSLVAGRPLAEPNTDDSTTDRRLLAVDGAVLLLDAATSEVGPGLLALENSEGDAVWSSPDDPLMSSELHNAGYDQAYGGAVVFSAPAGATAEVGTYGEGKPVGVKNRAWGDEFSAVVWYKSGQLALGDNPVLVQVAGLDARGDLRTSATWRVAGFEDQSQGSIPIPGFAAAPTFTADSLGDCWVQLAVVKSGPALEFYKDQQLAGTASSAFVVNDYAADVLALGVDYSRLTEPGSNATTIDAAALSEPLGWLSGSLGTVEIYSRALTAAEIAAKYAERSTRFAESLCSLEVPITGMPPSSDQPSGAPPTPDLPTGPSPPLDQPSSPSPPLGQPTGNSPPLGQPTGNSPPLDQPTGNSPPVNQPALPSPMPTIPSPMPNQPGPSASPPPPSSPKPPSTYDNSTATVTGSGTSGAVTNVLTMTGGEELAGLESDPLKQEQLKQAILASLNLPPGYTTDNIEINVVSVVQEGSRRRLQADQIKVVVEYTLTATPEVPVEELEKAEISIYLFIRVQQPTIPWWSGPSATVCISNIEGACNPSTPPITPPVVVEECSANVCFLLDGSKSLMNVDAWNDVVAAARSIMYSINDPVAKFDVFWFSNDVEKIIDATGAEVATDNSIISTIVNTIPKAHGTWMAQAISTCQDVLLNEDTEASRTIVLITDGKPTDRQPTLEAAEAAKQWGIKMVVVGAGDVDYATLKDLASGPQFVFANTNLDSSQLMLMADLASEGVCREEDR